MRKMREVRRMLRHWTSLRLKRIKQLSAIPAAAETAGDPEPRGEALDIDALGTMPDLPEAAEAAGNPATDSPAPDPAAPAIATTEVPTAPEPPGEDAPVAAPTATSPTEASLFAGIGQAVGTPAASPEESTAQSQDEDTDGDSSEEDDLMSLFSEELVENSDLHLLASSLGDVDVRELVQGCSDVAERLSRYRRDRN